jgi:hypothetical protein
MDFKAGPFRILQDAKAQMSAMKLKADEKMTTVY